MLFRKYLTPDHELAQPEYQAEVKGSRAEWPMLHHGVAKRTAKKSDQLEQRATCHEQQPAEDQLVGPQVQSRQEAGHR
jgi:hypothetical protein